MTGQLEDAQNSEHFEQSQNAFGIVKVGVGSNVEEQRHVVGHHGQKVDYVQELGDELELVGRGQESEQKLEREPNDTERFHLLENGVFLVGE